MRLIDTTSMQMRWFEDPPEYAILSHTWGCEEVTLYDFEHKLNTHTAGYRKIEKLCELARERDLPYAWIDTCCIDKTNLVELTESILSMFAWYCWAETCFVFLEDLPATNDRTEAPSVAELEKCRWLTRGWTLQELLAPTEVIFYDQEFQEVCERDSFATQIGTITGIPESVLRQTKLVHEVCIAQRMSWVSQRLTTRPEDIAYCMLGIFGIDMSLFYGEGRRAAFIRLQEQIVARHDDESIFAWQSGLSSDSQAARSPLPSPPVDRERTTGEEKSDQRLGILAEDPEAFSHGGSIRRLYTLQGSARPPYAFSNRGLEISIHSRLDPWRGTSAILMLDCYNVESNKQIFVDIRRNLELHGRLWYRSSGVVSMASLSSISRALRELGAGYTKVCIARSQLDLHSFSLQPNEHVVRLGRQPLFSVLMQACIVLLFVVGPWAAFLTPEKRNTWAYEPLRMTIPWASLTIAWQYSQQSIWFPVAALGVSRLLLGCGLDSLFEGYTLWHEAAVLALITVFAQPQLIYAVVRIDFDDGIVSLMSILTRRQIPDR